MAAHSERASAKSLRDILRLAAGPVNLLGYDTAAKPLAPGGKAKTEQKLLAHAGELTEAQTKLFASGLDGDARRVLLVLQGMDTSGKDGVISHVVGLVGPAGVKITAFKKPSAEEAAHHFLWRIRRALPGPGMIGVFNRSHYEDVLVPRVHEQIDEAQWAERVNDINKFESQLVESGTTLIKCFLHISYAAQRERLLSRLDDPQRQWKFNPGDIEERAYWADYQTVYGSVLEQTSTDVAPWYVIPSDSKWYRNWAIGTLLADTFADMKLTYPEHNLDIEGLQARLRPPH